MRTSLVGTFVLAFCLVGTLLGDGEKPPARPDDKTVRQNALRISGREQKPDARRVEGITDADLFAALDLELEALKTVKTAVEKKDFDAAWKAWHDYALNRMPALGPLKSIRKSRADLKGRRKKQPMGRADDLVQHKIRVWHHQVVEFGPKMDWTNVKGVSALYGFHYWGWAPPLADAWLRTGDAKYARCFDGLITTWWAQRDAVSKKIKSKRIIWYELGCSRVIRIAQLWYALLDADAYSPTARRLTMRIILAHARQLEDMESIGYKDGNFQIYACQTLYAMGIAFPMFKEAKRWRKTAVTRLIEHARWDFHEDGGHSERCVGYGRMCTDGVASLLEYSADDPAPDPAIEELRKRVSKMRRWFLMMATPTGEFVGVNDSEFSRADILLSRYGTEAKDPRFYWPIRGSKRIPKGAEPRKPEFLSVHLKQSGWTVMRDGWERSSMFLQVNWGGYGGHHTHPCKLDLNIYALGRPLLIEAGRFDSYDHPLNPYFRSPEAHNQLVIPGAKYDRRFARGVDVQYGDGKRIAFFAGSHDGWAASAGVRVRREILFVKGGYWLVIDSPQKAPKAKAIQAKNCAAYWHSPQQWKITDTGAVAGKGPGVRLTVLPKGKSETGTGYKDTIELHKHRRWVRFERALDGSSRMVTLIRPVAKGDEKPWKLRILAETAGRIVLQVQGDGWTDLLLWRRKGRGSARFGPFVSDARAAWVRSIDQKAKWSALLDGVRIRGAGKKLIGGKKIAPFKESE